MRAPSKPAPDTVVKQAQALGVRVRAARARRSLRVEDLASRADMSLKTVQAIERGDLGTGIGAYLKILWALGLTSEIDLIADPGLDQTGLSLELSAQGKRVRVKKAVDNDF